MKLVIKYGLLFGIATTFFVGQYVSADDSVQKAQNRAARLAGQVQAKKSTPIIVPQDTAALTSYLRGYCGVVQGLWQKSFVQYEKMLEEMLYNEELYKDDYFVFYHAQQQENRVLVEFVRNLYAFIYKKPLREDFEYFRFWVDGSDYKDINSYLDSFGIPNPFSVGGRTLNDLSPAIRAVLLSVNPILFNNFDNEGSCTWDYFLRNRSLENFIKVALEKFFRTYGLQEKFIEQLLAINEQFPAPTGDLLQIFVPKELVNDCAYICHVYGIPQKEYIVDIAGKSLGLSDYDSVRQRYIKCSVILELMQTQADRIKDIQSIQVRLFISKYGPFLNPDMGVKIIRFSSLDQKQLQNYKAAVKGVTERMVAAHSGAIMRKVQQEVFGMQLGKLYSNIHQREREYRSEPDQRKRAVEAREQLTKPTTIFEAIKHPETMQWMGKFLKEKNVINAKDMFGDTPLIVATKEHKANVVQLLLKAGADINAFDRYKQTALMYAAKLGYGDVLQVLLKAGANKELGDENGLTALMHAAIAGSVMAVQILVAANVNQETADNNGWTALMHAAFLGKEVVIRFLVEMGADISAKNINGSTALDIAREIGNEEIVRYLKDMQKKQDREIKSSL
ncbi:MAG TPA: ankyrin repeat domain-containing protein [Candidatus Babeliales bacterium]|nr:ankyrin repeat domain-containing protein [Candidatus Babeliales bacterium]